MVQALMCRLLAAEAKVRYRGSICEICGKQSRIRTGSPPGTSFSPVSITPSMLHTHLHRNNTLLSQGHAGDTWETFMQAMLLWGYRGALDRKP
jgi:hypothetical protein